ncbi:MAG: TetR/AcrR family transcriptional regulator [Gammaproteobacteria bacterium]
MDAICERAGVKKGSFHYFFESKAALAIAALGATRNPWEITRVTPTCTTNRVALRSLRGLQRTGY